MRTTVDINAPVLAELRRIQRQEKKTLGELVSELLARALGERKAATPARRFGWISRPMGARVDLADKDAVYGVLDERPRRR